MEDGLRTRRRVEEAARDAPAAAEDDPEWRPGSRRRRKKPWTLKTRMREEKGYNAALVLGVGVAAVVCATLVLLLMVVPRLEARGSTRRVPLVVVDRAEDALHTWPEGAAALVVLDGRAPDGRGELAALADAAGAKRVVWVVAGEEPRASGGAAEVYPSWPAGLDATDAVVVLAAASMEPSDGWDPVASAATLRGVCAEAVAGARAVFVMRSGAIRSRVRDEAAAAARAETRVLKAVEAAAARQRGVAAEVKYAPGLARVQQ